MSTTNFCEGELLTATTNGAEECYNFYWQLDTLVMSNTANFDWLSDTSGMFDLFIIKSNSICFKDSLISLIIHPKTAVELSVFQCSGDSLFVGGAYQFSAGIYVDSLQTIFGCDSIVSTALQNYSLPNVTLFRI